MARSKEYKCRICQKIYVAKSSLQRHYREAHKKGKYALHPCPFCDHKSKQNSDLTKHIDVKHPESAKPRGRREKHRHATTLDTEYMERMMSRAILKALGKKESTLKKRHRPVISSDDESPAKLPRFDPDIFSDDQPSTSTDTNVGTIHDTEIGPVLHIAPAEEIVSINLASVENLTSGDSTPVQDEVYYQPIVEPITPDIVITSTPNQNSQQNEIGLLPIPDYDINPLENEYEGDVETFDRTEELARLFNGSRDLSPTLRDDLQISDSSDTDETFEWEEPTNLEETVNLNETVDYTTLTEPTTANDEAPQDNMVAKVEDDDTYHDDRDNDDNKSHTENEFNDNGRQGQQFHYRYSKTTTYEGSCFIQ